LEQIPRRVSELGDWLGLIFNRFILFLPDLLIALALVVFGIILARFLRRMTGRGIVAVERASERAFGQRSALRPQFGSRSIRIGGDVVFWIVIVVFVAASMRVLGLDAFAIWLDRIVEHLPNLVVGAVIIAFGFALATLAGDVAEVAAQTAGLEHGRLVGRTTQFAILTVAAIVGLDQFGIDVTFLVTLIAILLGALAGGLALAFALGARDHVDNLIGAHHLRRRFRPGQAIRMGGVDGRIVEISTTSVVISTPDGQVMVPGRTFNREPTTLLESEDDRG